MKNSIQYIVNDKGVKTSVIVPYSEWEKFQTDYNKLQHKVDVFLAIQEGLNEIKTAKEYHTELQTLTDFLNESNS
jgi:hypothetical protein